MGGVGKDSIWARLEGAIPLESLAAVPVPPGAPASGAMAIFIMLTGVAIAGAIWLLRQKGD